MHVLVCASVAQTLKHVSHASIATGHVIGPYCITDANISTASRTLLKFGNAELPYEPARSARCGVEVQQPPLIG